MIIRTNQMVPPEPATTDGPTHLSRADPTGADLLDGTQQPTDLAAGVEPIARRGTRDISLVRTAGPWICDAGAAGWDPRTRSVAMRWMGRRRAIRSRIGRSKLTRRSAEPALLG